MVENFDEWLAIRKSFPYKPLSLNISPLNAIINSSKFSPIKLLCYTVEILCGYKPCFSCWVTYSLPTKMVDYIIFVYVNESI